MSSSPRFHPNGEPDAETILLAYYEVYEPSFASREKISKIVGSYQRKAAKSGGDWEVLLYTDFVNQSGVDPRVFWQEQQRSPRPDYMPGEMESSAKNEALDRLARAKESAVVNDTVAARERRQKKDRIADR